MFRHIAIFLMVICGLVLFQHHDAWAVDAKDANLLKPNLTFKCAANDGEYTQAIVRCLQDPVRRAVLEPNNGLLAKSVAGMNKVTIALITLAIIWLGVRALAGEASFFPRAMALAIRIGFVLTVFKLAIAYSPNLYTFLDGTIPSNFSPWVQIDQFITKLLGITKGNSTLKDGIIGLLDGSFFSKNMGVMLSIIGMVAVISLLTFIFQAVYLFLASVVAIGFLIIILPFLMPFFLFSYTEHYIIKWFDILISTLLTPLLMFYFMMIFMVDFPARPATAFNPEQPAMPGIFKGLVDDIFTLLPRNYMFSCGRENQPLLPAQDRKGDTVAYINEACRPGGPDGQTNAINCTEYKKVNSGVMSTTNPTANKTSNMFSGLKAPKIDCGDKDPDPTKNDPYIKEQVTKKLFLLFMYAMLLNAGLKIIPSISSDIARGATSGVANLTTPLTRALQSLKK